MRKTAVAALVTGVLMAGGMGGCQGDLVAQNPDEYVGGIVSDIRTQAAEEFKKALLNEVAEFFKSDDLSESLGFDSEEQAKIEESLKTYINNYDMDEEKLSEAKESLNALLENAQGLSAEEIQEKIEGIFAE